MSFSEEQKAHIIKEQFKNVCCRRAFLFAVLAAKGRCEKDHILVFLEKNEYCEFVSKFIFEFYGKHPEITTPSKGGRYKILQILHNWYF